MRSYFACISSSLCLCLFTVAAWSQSSLEQFWQRGHVRELFIGGLPQDEAGLKMWADNGVNCVTGVKPEVAHQCGLKTRTWFTMNYMDSRNMDEAKIKAMAAIHEDGTYARPFDPLFPTVGQYGWSACINNPQWIEHSQAIFRRYAQEGYDGCHIDFAGHYEQCFCQYCQAKWKTWATGKGLAGVELKAASHSQDFRNGMLLREFRIQCVTEFLGGLRKVAREIKPGFANDGTWHQDSGSTYQWAYGEHFDLMCIEGTTYDAFPPASTQVLWLKLAHALSEKPNHKPIAMSVTYHLLPNDKGVVHHGRMAPDRLRVALAEISSQGTVSWLGLGGPDTGNLLREHQDIVKAYSRIGRDTEPYIADADELAEIGIVFSPKTYLLADVMRTQLYALGQALMKSHIPFKLLSDVGLGSRQLRGLSGVVLLNARALSDAGCKALDDYAQQGGKILCLASDTATLTEDWRDRRPRPQFAVPPEGGKGIVERSVGKGRCYYWLEDVFAGKALGAAQNVVLSQEKPVKLAVEGWSKAEAVSGGADANYSLYVDLLHQDGSPLWGQTATFSTGTHDWQFSRKIIESGRPIKSANIHILFRSHQGTVWFRDVKFGVWDEDKQQIVKNLLGSTFKPSDGKVYSAAPGEEAQEGAWGPYRDGFEVVNMLDLGLWVKMSSTSGLSVGNMHEPQTASDRKVMEVLKPLLPTTPMISLTGNGADRVFINLSRKGNRFTIQLINYNAELHPQLPEMEQQQKDRTITATDLVLTFRPPAGSRINAANLRSFFPEATARVKCENRNGGIVVTLDKLGQYAVLEVE